MTAEDAYLAEPGGKRASGWRRLGIQSKLLAMLLGVSVLSALVVGFLGYRFGTEALRDAAFERLTEVRESRTTEIRQELATLRDSQVIHTQGLTANEAVQAFSEGFADLANSEITPEQEAMIEAYYSEMYVPDWTKISGGPIEPEAFLPDSAPQRYLQATYAAPHTDFEEAIAVDDAGDGSAWSRAHARFHDFFRKITLRFGYEDVLLLDTEGNVVYTAFKGFDLGSNVRSGPLRGSFLQDAYEEAIRSGSVDHVTLTDFQRYPRHIGTPSAWSVSPVGMDGEVIGAMALQFPTSAINRIMTGGGDWADVGLGESGETMLVGADGKMRSVSRFLLEDPEQFERDVVDAGTPTAVAAEMTRTGGSIRLQPVEADEIDRAIGGQSGTTITRDYRGKESLLAYAPVQDEDLQWAIVAKIDESEAFAPVHSFARNLALWTAGIVLLVSLASLLLARLLVRPIQRLIEGVRRIAAGELDVTVEATSGDELGDLAQAFNDMSRSLTIRAQLIEQQQAEHNRMLLALMPEPVARRYRDGEAAITEERTNVSVVFADIIGFDELASTLTSDESLALLNGLTRAFDDAAEKFGVERVRNLRRGYLASCGLVTPRIDHARRVVDFARSMQDALDNFNVRHGAQLDLQAGIDTGTVRSGLVGQASVVYEIWGDAVNLAFRTHDHTREAGIFVTAAVRDGLSDDYEFEEAGQIETDGGPTPVWRLNVRRPSRV